MPKSSRVRQRAAGNSHSSGSSANREFGGFSHGNRILAVLMEKPIQNDINIVAGIETRHIDAITTNVLDFRLVVIRAVSE
jgi:hypothetical protein